ncbi:DUF2779 domain-containing protein [Formosa sediminum]|uniref:DUF2779 domain-containing protein n=1 Tax=Formosa sediminum TaxID=2594004 RepID=A0A516GUV8_9FLAO|nr:DUF2779 domain-containing protein [Formosa sediminum]QDO95303.1 DUF2779 domain-containing protein [Formosa sediminum]
MNTERYLTKSRFKLGLECPTKLFYTRKSEYVNQQLSNPFLEALAEGGFQVEELARMQYPDGIAILGNDWNYGLLAQKTEKLLQQDQVVIFEAAFLYNSLFIRVDILEKKGNHINLFEVKAKSVNANNHESFIGKRGGLTAGWSTYLYDVAFQKYVIQKCHPDWKIKSFLKLVNKDAVATVDGINQCFKISKSSDLRTGIIKKEGLLLDDLGENLLSDINIEVELEYIYKNNPLNETLGFEALLIMFRDHYAQDKKLIEPIGSQCKSCEYYTEPPTESAKSGFHDCWTTQLQITNQAANMPKVYDVWNFRGAKKLIESGKYFISDLNEADVNPQSEALKISNSERRWIQVEKEQQNDNTPFIELDGLKLEMSTWVYPLNFIDFETSMVALPFTAGRHPYEQTAFQFSHHIVYEDGRINHATEYLNATVGEFPNFKFVRALKQALEKNEGSIFRYHNHENTVLNQIHDQLADSNEPDKTELQAFIERITHSPGNRTKKWQGTRDMIDLYRVVKDYYYHPITEGSISIKAILPAVLNSSMFLKEKYANPIEDIQVTSKNFNEDHAFITIKDGLVISPYKTLPALFEDWSENQLEDLVSEMSSISDGGAALTAYSKLQFETMQESERLEISKGLLKYCELDTLAMVMIYEYFKSL